MASVDTTTTSQGSAAADDGRSMNSAASTAMWESVFGHDDATAPVNNCSTTKALDIPDCGTIGSLSTQSMNLDYYPNVGRESPRKYIALQLGELDDQDPLALSRNKTKKEEGQTPETASADTGENTSEQNGRIPDLKMMEEGGQADKTSNATKMEKSIGGTGLWKLSLDDVEEVVEFEQISATATFNSSGDEPSREERKNDAAKHKWHMPVAVVIIIIVVAIAAYFGTKKNGTGTSAGLNPSAIDQSPTEAPTKSLMDSPAVSPISPEVPTPRPSVVPTANPTFSPTSQLSTSPSLQPSVSLEPTFSDPVFGHLYSLSGDWLLLEDSPQFQAYEWLVQVDLLSLNLTEIPLKDVEQRYLGALVYFSLDGDSWKEDLGFLSQASVCEWKDDSGEGIMCDSTNTIVGIVSNDNNMSGALPFELKHLSFLKKLQIRSNRVHGSIPMEFGELLLLEDMDLGENELEGDVPESIFHLPKLRNLHLLQNSRLSGTIPKSIHLASNLEMLSFSLCNMTGSLPESIGKLSKLRLLSFADNSLNGSIPEEMFSLSKLQVLELSGNSITGAIPDFGESDLYYVALSGNKLTGRIPNSIGSLQRLSVLDINDNEIGSSIPSSIGNLPRLVSLSASKNELTGVLPLFPGNEGELRAIDLSNNKLSGHMIKFFGEDGPKHLTSLNFDSNDLVGMIPRLIGACSSLRRVSLANNRFSGDLPEELGQLTALRSLSVHHNSFAGPIPSSIGMLEKLGMCVWTPIGLQICLMLLVELLLLTQSSLNCFDNIDELRLDNNHFDGSLDEVFCRSDSRERSIFSADCRMPRPEIECSCCTTCCKTSGCVDS
eukprot:scaffold319_cov97-Cylindrotheca_fusiformis.AAC.5